MPDPPKDLGVGLPPGDFDYAVQCPSLPRSEFGPEGTYCQTMVGRAERDSAEFLIQETREFAKTKPKLLLVRSET